jgi:DNA polymerase III sliding clamp (beta) subunit (PCNA family)
MTITTTETRPAVLAAGDGFEMPGHVFRDLLVGGLVAASDDATLPTLCAVFLEWGVDGVNTVTVASTDRYRLARGVWTGDPDAGTRRAENVRGGASGAGAFLMPRVVAAELVKILPKSTKRGGGVSVVRCELVASHLVVSFTDPVSGSAWSRDVTGGGGEFPKYRSLIPDFDSVPASEDIRTVAWNASYMADAAKFPADLRMITWNIVGGKPMVGTFPESAAGITWTYLLMQVRIPS